MARSGAVLREVGTTNRTTSPIIATPSTNAPALLLRVHPSNFRIDRLHRAARRCTNWSRSAANAASRSMRIWAAAAWWISRPFGIDEPLVARQPEGRRRPGFVQRRQTARRSASRHPRRQAGARRAPAPQSAVPRPAPDKTDLPGTGSNAAAHLLWSNGTQVPALRMIRQSAAKSARAPKPLLSRIRAHRLQRRVDARRIRHRRRLHARAIHPHLADRHRSATMKSPRSESCRQNDPPVIARIEEKRVVLDLRTVLPDEEAELAAALQALS